MWCSEWRGVTVSIVILIHVYVGNYPKGFYHSETICLIQVWKQHMRLITAVVAGP
jgi:hypothetical protein